MMGSDGVRDAVAEPPVGAAARDGVEDDRDWSSEADTGSPRRAANFFNPLSPERVKRRKGLRPVGKGRERVYAYYFEYVRRYAVSRFNTPKRWPIKVGRTSAEDVATRIAQQHTNAGLPEPPVICFEAHTDRSEWLEQKLHEKLHRRRMEGGAGVEWFQTSPQEIRHFRWRILLIDRIRRLIGRAA